MAGDWIKMRGALLDHPKVIAIARHLQAHKPFRDWLTPGLVDGNMVSDTALRCVTTALLMRVWSGAREHGKFVEDDLVLPYSDIADLDQMAGAPGVGEAMELVQWAVRNVGVTLPNFKEFNVPMTSAEKQKEYRNRKLAVTEALPKQGNEIAKNVTSREEKRRVTTPLPPEGGFLEFWNAWPKSIRKQAQGKCEGIWKRFNLEKQVSKVLAHVEALKLSEEWKREGGRYIPAPQVYLNQKRWEGAELLEAQEKRVAM